jgi:serine/threonine-protein kinase RsbW
MHVSLPSAHDQLSRLRRMLRERLAGPRFSHAAVNDLVLAVQEAAANAITHGNRLDSSKSVTVSVDCQAEGVAVEVADEGAGFDWRGCLERIERDGIAPDAPRGRGLLVICRTVDEVTYNAAGSAVRLLKRYDR